MLTHHRPWLGAGRAAQRSLRLLQETSLGKTLPAMGSTPAGLVPPEISKARRPRVGRGPTNRRPHRACHPRDKNIITHSENQIATATMVACGPCMDHVNRMVCGFNPLVVRPRLLCGSVANTRTLTCANLGACNFNWTSSSSQTPALTHIS